MEDSSDINRCIKCGFCRAVCPVFEVLKFEGGVARGKIQTLKYIEEGVLEPTEKAISRIFQCTTCNACVSACPAGVETSRIIEEFRSKYRDKIELPTLQWMGDITEMMGNPYGEEMAEDATKALVAYFPGCTTQFRAGEIQTSIEKILNITEGEGNFKKITNFCCGESLKIFGEEGKFQDLFHNNKKILEGSGIKEFIVSCPGCYKTFKEEYGDIFKENEIQLIYITDYLLEKIKEGSIELGTLPYSLTYHDPCHLGRHSNIYDSPRELIRSIPSPDFREMAKNRENSRCCGAGGALGATFREISSAIGNKRIEDARETGTKIITTSCPSCYLQLKGLGEDFHLYDLSMLIAKLMK